MDKPNSNYYDGIYESERHAGSSVQGAAELAAEAYIDGKPRTRGKHKVTESERRNAYWSSEHVKMVPLDGWRAHVMTLALAQYLGQDLGANFAQLERVAAVPGLLKRAVRISGLVMRPDSSRRRELESLAPRLPEIAELCRILAIFDEAHRLRSVDVQKWHRVLDELSIVDLMLYASMFAFEVLVPEAFANQSKQWVESPAERQRMEQQWDAIADIFHWKLRQTPHEKLKITESSLGQSLAAHLSPFIFPSPSGMPAREDLRHAFAELVSCQLELNAFEAKSADAFSFDESIDFIRQGTNLEIVEVDADARKKWNRDGAKLEKLHGYWFDRAFETFLASDAATQTIGRPENHDGNPPPDDPSNAGEIDLICARDGKVLVIEAKSTYIRRTQRDAWLHATTTLRKAGRQSQRNVAAVNRALARNSDLATLLCLDVEASGAATIGWIVDTSIEHDHLRFSGHLAIESLGLISSTGCVFRAREKPVHGIRANDDFAHDRILPFPFTIACHSCWNVSKVAWLLLNSTAVTSPM